MIPYNPADAIQCWPEGRYNANLVAVKEATSKAKGTPMLVLTLRVYQVSGQEQPITDYVTIPDGTWKLKQLADAIGQRQAFDSGVFDPAEHINSYFVVELVVEDNEGYSPRNKVKRYAVAARKSPSTPSAKAAAVDRQAAQAQAGGDPLSDTPQFKEDDIPF